jgi:hypothetical protein
MVDIDVDVEHSLVVLEQLQDSEHDIVDIAKAACTLLLGMMKASRPIYAYVRTLVV